jgi:hypothetical protein
MLLVLVLIITQLGYESVGAVWAANKYNPYINT